MSKQRIPAAMPSDPELLNFLQANTVEGKSWVCRKWRAGMGHAIYETTIIEAAKQGLTAYPTIREAIAAAIGKEKENDDEQNKVPT